MSYKDIVNDIKENNLKQVYIFYGNEKYMIKWITSNLKEKYITKSFESLNYVVTDAKEVNVENILDACETLPFMDERKIVVVENASVILNNKAEDVGKNEKLINYFKNPCKSTILIFKLSDEKIDNRKKIIKEIKKIGLVINFTKLERDELKKWLLKILKKNKKKITSKCVDYFIESTGYLEYGNNKTLYDLENEILKLINFVGDKEHITEEDVDKVIIKSIENNIFKLVDNIGYKNSKKALSILNDMVLDNSPLPMILFMIIRQFRLLLRCKLLFERGYTDYDIAKKVGVQSFVIKKLLKQCKNFSCKELEDILVKCLNLDKSVKSGQLDNRLALEMLFINVSNN